MTNKKETNSIRYHMDKKGMTCRKMADKLFCSETLISYFCSGKRTPSPEMLDMMAIILEVTPEELLKPRTESDIYMEKAAEAMCVEGRSCDCFIPVYAGCAECEPDAVLKPVFNEQLKKTSLKEFFAQQRSLFWVSLSIIAFLLLILAALSSEASLVALIVTVAALFLYEFHGRKTPISLMEGVVFGAAGFMAVLAMIMLWAAYF